jgi:hypothetical protein
VVYGDYFEEEKFKQRIEDAKHYSKTKDDKIDYKKLWKLLGADLTSEEKEAKFELDKEQSKISKLQLEVEKLPDAQKSSVPSKGSKEEKSTDQFVPISNPAPNQNKSPGVLHPSISVKGEKTGLFDKTRSERHRAGCLGELDQDRHKRH